MFLDNFKQIFGSWTLIVFRRSATKNVLIIINSFEIIKLFEKVQ
jgi:hypothetical protein